MLQAVTAVVRTVMHYGSDMRSADVSYLYHILYCTSYLQVLVVLVKIEAMDIGLVFKH